MTEHHVVRWHTTESVATALVVKRGSKMLHVIRAAGIGSDGRVAVERVPLTEERYMRPLLHREKPYPVERYKQSLRARARRCGATKEARRYLR